MKAPAQPLERVKDICFVYKTPKKSGPHCKMKVEIEVFGTMPFDFERASDMEYPIRCAFTDQVEHQVFGLCVQYPQGKSGFGLVVNSFRWPRGRCDVCVSMTASRPVPDRQLERLMETYIMPIIEHRLKPVFKQDERDARRANRFAYRILHKRGHDIRQVDDARLAQELTEVDETTYEHVLGLAVEIPLPFLPR